MSGYPSALPHVRLSFCTAPCQAILLYCPMSGYPSVLPHVRLSFCTAPCQAILLHGPMSGYPSALPHVRLSFSLSQHLLIPISGYTLTFPNINIIDSNLLFSISFQVFYSHITWVFYMLRVFDCTVGR